MPQNQGPAIVYDIERSKSGNPHHPYKTAIVIRECMAGGYNVRYNLHGGYK